MLQYGTFWYYMVLYGTLWYGFDAYANRPGRHIANVLFILKVGHCLRTQRITKIDMVISKPKCSAGFKGEKYNI